MACISPRHQKNDADLAAFSRLDDFFSYALGQLQGRHSGSCSSSFRRRSVGKSERAHSFVQSVGKAFQRISQVIRVSTRDVEELVGC